MQLSQLFRKQHWTLEDVWLVYAHVFILFSVVVVALPLYSCQMPALKTWCWVKLSAQLKWNWNKTETQKFQNCFVSCFIPCYLRELCIPVSTVPNLSALRSAARGDLVVPRTWLQLGNRAFCVAGPVAWNSVPLPPYIINFQKHAQVTSFLTFLLNWLTVSRSTSSEHCTAPL